MFRSSNIRVPFQSSEGALRMSVNYLNKLHCDRVVELCLPESCLSGSKLNCAAGADADAMQALHANIQVESSSSSSGYSSANYCNWTVKLRRRCLVSSCCVRAHKFNTEVVPICL